MSTEYVIELLQVPVNDSFSAQGDVFAKLLEGGKKGGATSQAYGRSVEDPSKVYWLAHFESGIVPKTFKWPEGYGDFSEEIGKISTAPLKSLFTTLKGPFPKHITNAPVTEIATISLKPGVDKVEYTKRMDAFIAESVAPASGVESTLWTFATEDREWSVDKANVVIVFVGKNAGAHEGNAD